MAMLLAALLLLFIAPRDAHATYSVVGTDTAEGLAGISIASCVGSLDLDIAVGMAPGRGVVAAQASVDGQFRGRTLAVELLEEGQLGAPAIVERITQTAVDPNPQSRCDHRPTTDPTCSRSRARCTDIARDLPGSTASPRSPPPRGRSWPRTGRAAARGRGAAARTASTQRSASPTLRRETS